MRPRHLVLVGQHVTLVAPAWQPAAPLAALDLQDALPPPEVTPHPPDPDRSASDDERARQLVARVSRGLLEGLQRRRSTHQLAAWMTPEAHQVLVAWSRQRDWRTTRVTGVRASRAARLAVEGVLLLADERDHHVGATVRLEHAHGRWSVTVFDMLLPPAALGRAS